MKRYGKLTNDELNEIIFSEIKVRRDEVILRAGVGEDCAAIAMNGMACVLSTDPITASSVNVGSLAMLVSLNDVASSGAAPLAALLTILAPPEATVEDIKEVVYSACNEAQRNNIEIIGGHTEWTDAVTRIVVSSTVIGIVEQSRLITSSGANIGDDIIMTKTAAIEGATILAREHAKELTNVLTDEEMVDIMEIESFISVVKDGMIAAKNGASAMHDVTEGGILSASYELARASGKGIELYADAIPVLPAVKKLCDYFGINPLGLLSSGVMLITHHDSRKLCDALAAEGIPAAVIGKILPDGYTLIEGGIRRELQPLARDEIYNIRKS